MINGLKVCMLGLYSCMSRYEDGTKSSDNHFLDDSNKSIKGILIFHVSPNLHVEKFM